MGCWLGVLGKGRWKVVEWVSKAVSEDTVVMKGMEEWVEEASSVDLVKMVVTRPSCLEELVVSPTTCAPSYNVPTKAETTLAGSEVEACAVSPGQRHP